MPLSPFQERVMRALAAKRTPESYVAGGSPITDAPARISGDIDIFHDRQSLVDKAAEADCKVLEGLGLTVEWVQRLPGLWRCVVKGGPEPLRLDWAHDSAFRFYPAKADPKFGYVLHPADLMTSKVLAAAGRSQPRDLVDIVTLSADVPIVAGILAAVGKDPGMTPDTVIDNIAMFGRHDQSAFDRLRSTGPIDGPAVQAQVRGALTVARTLAAKLPAKSFGRLFFEDGRIVVPDPDRLDTYRVRSPSKGGVAPRTDGMSAGEMAKRYKGYER